MESFWQLSFSLLKVQFFLESVWAFSMLLTINDSKYFLAKSNSCNSFNLLFKFFSLVQILTILKESKYGMAHVVLLGWQLEGSRYWFWSVFFLKRSMTILLFSIFNKVSRNGMESVLSQPHLSSSELIFNGGMDHSKF